MQKNISYVKLIRGSCISAGGWCIIRIIPHTTVCEHIHNLT